MSDTFIPLASREIYTGPACPDNHHDDVDVAALFSEPAHPVDRWKKPGNWFCQQRQEWIEEVLRIFGFINREHLERKFGISTPQASNDLRDFQINNPGWMTYNASAKRYEAAS